MSSHGFYSVSLSAQCADTTEQSPQLTSARPAWWSGSWVLRPARRESGSQNADRTCQADGSWQLERELAPHGATNKRLHPEVSSSILQFLVFTKEAVVVKT